MTPDEIRHHPLFEKLTERQQVFVDQLLINGNDKIAAAHKAWTCNGDQSARTLANRNLADERVAYLVEAYFGKDPDRIQFTREGALELLAKKARATKDDKLCLDYMKVILMMNGWLVKQQEKPVDQPRDDGNDLITI